MAANYKKVSCFFMPIFNKKDVKTNGHASLYCQPRKIQ